MTLSEWREEPISKKHDRGSFDCGEPTLNEFLRKHARQSHDKGAAKTFLAVSESAGKTILGFYSLSPVAARNHPGRGFREDVILGPFRTRSNPTHRRTALLMPSVSNRQSTLDGSGEPSYDI